MCMHELDANLVDDVKALVNGLAVIEQVHASRSDGRASSDQRQRSGQTTEQLAAGAGRVDDQRGSAAGSDCACEGMVLSIASF